ncbi:hypothetical protein EV359DRAFT_3016, partial [Lentinula novae-zelandiae]
WSMSPDKLQLFINKEMFPTVAKDYVKHITGTGMPEGLEKYLELELFPHIGLKGFKYTEHKKALYYDGHEHADVVQYQQDEFIPKFLKYFPRLVEYVVGDVNTLKEKVLPPGVERWLVLVAHDEMTAQANDGMKWSWVFEGEHAIRKKGVGRGIHQSNVICSTYGWLKDASQTLEYGKNYDGYWNGELFIKQVR